MPVVSTARKNEAKIRGGCAYRLTSDSPRYPGGAALPPTASPCSPHPSLAHRVPLHLYGIDYSTRHERSAKWPNGKACWFAWEADTLAAATFCYTPSLPDAFEGGSAECPRTPTRSAVLPLRQEMSPRETVLAHTRTCQRLSLSSASNIFLSSAVTLSESSFAVSGSLVRRVLRYSLRRSIGCSRKGT